MLFLNIYGVAVSTIFMAFCLKKIGILEISYKETGLYYIILAVATYLYQFVITIPYALFYVMGSIIVIMSFLHKCVIKSVLTGIIASILYVLSDALAGVIVLLLFGENAYDSYVQIRILTLIISSVVLLVLSFLTEFFAAKIDGSILSHEMIYFIILELLLTFILIYINHMASTYMGVKKDSAYIWISGGLYILYFLSSVILFITIVRYMLKENQNRQEKQMWEANKKYIAEMESSYTSLRKIKHDYVNILTSLKIYIDENDIKGLKKYYYDELQALNQDLLIQNKLLTVLQNMRISEIKSILMYKCALAQEKKLEVNLEIPDEINHVGMSTAILCQILGILLDNAMEAAEETAKKELRIAVMDNTSSVTFVIQNAYEQLEVSINQLFQKGYSTKSGGRGLGLATVRDYTNKVENLYLETQVEEEYFTQVLMIKE